MAEMTRRSKSVVYATAPRSTTMKPRQRTMKYVQLAGVNPKICVS
jgi:hypothetical protein